MAEGLDYKAREELEGKEAKGTRYCNFFPPKTLGYNLPGKRIGLGQQGRLPELLRHAQAPRGTGGTPMGGEGQGWQLKKGRAHKDSSSEALSVTIGPGSVTCGGGLLGRV